MVAKIKATGEIVDIIRNSAFDRNVYYTNEGKSYHRNEFYFL